MTSMSKGADGRLTDAKITIRDAQPQDEARWRVLWAGYTAFYEAEIPADITAYTWERILDPASSIFCRVAENAGVVVGFAVCVLHPGTWDRGPRCYLEDLFVDEAVRGGGIGRMLIQNLIDAGKAEGWQDLYWHTKASNATARRLYDSFAPADEFVRYRLPLA
ncbi:GNAT family N-acetyltransferase [Xanthobacter sp. DSM 24535]|uniref:GNAT family N-acetyltransferase n=1 Tax=Roseixanthobacter psychrophilus TaxID=3119917 RepID=UPI00372C78A5